jgi:membrane associated rhomboid family serine protease
MERRRLVTIRIGDDEEDLTWEQWEQRVRAGRIPPSTLVRFEPVTGDAFQRASDLDLFHSMSEASRRAWADRYRSGAPPWMTALLAGAQIQLWWIVATGRMGGDPDVAPAMVRVGETMRLWNPAILEQGEIWRVVTAGLYHEDLLHIGSNLVMLVYVGWHLERALGRLNLLTVFLVSVVGGSLASMFLTPDTPSIGASGGVLGVVAAATVFGFVRHGLLSDRARIIFGWALLPYLVLIYTLGWTSPSTDNWAHTGGLVTGALLALVLDPPGMERRSGWNVLAVGSAWVAVVAVLGGLWLGGSSLIDVDDVQARMAGPLARPKHREVVWTAPTTWERATVQGAPGYVSRAARARGWAVRTRNSDRPIDADAEARAFAERLVAEWTGGAVALEPEPAELAGRPAVRVRVEVDRGDGFVVERTIAARGNQMLEATWSVDKARERALRPLRDRLLDSVEWDVPESLLRAEDAVQRKPKNRALRRALADELLLVGRTDEAVATWRALIADRPSQPDGWVGLLRVARTHPGAVGDVEALCADALGATDDPQVASDVALTLDSAGQGEAARGLLELAWTYRPGHRHLRAARRQLGQTTLLWGVGPAQNGVDPLTGARLAAPLREPVPGPWSLERAREVGAELAATRRILAEQVVAEPGVGALAPLLLLRVGVIPDPDDLPDAIEAVIADLRIAAQGDPARWMPPEVAAWVRSREATEPGLGARLSEAAAPPAPVLDDADLIDVDAWLDRLGLRRVTTPDGAVLERG